MTPPSGSGISSATRSPSTSTTPPRMSSRRFTARAIASGLRPRTRMLKSVVIVEARASMRSPKPATTPGATQRPARSTRAARRSPGARARSSSRVMTALTSRITGYCVRGGSRKSSGRARQRTVRRASGRPKARRQSGSGTETRTRPSRAASRPRATTASGRGSLRSRSRQRSA